MHVLFVSACEKRALRRTRAVLDSYAIRTGASAWASPMTEEGLREVRAALKRTATRQTAVACYRNDGRMRMKLLWIVGSRDAFGPDGPFPVGTTRNKPASAVPGWVRVASLLAQAGGWCHDLGKASVPFQQKLAANGTQSDPARHEWLSIKLLHAIRDEGLDWEAAWAKAAVNHTWLKATPFERGVRTARDALDYLIVTHHKLLGPVDKAQRQAPPDHSRHVTGTSNELSKLKPQASLPAKPIEAAAALLERIEKLAPSESPAYWRVVAMIARAGLILADHVVSAQSRPGEAPLYANTHQGRLNQALDWHLGEVAHVAGEAAFRIATLRLPRLSEESIEAICQPAEDNSPFAWQNRAADALGAFRERSARPILVFNMAGTGCGKTRMNARAACVLGRNGVRFAVALNLRTLTLQTGDAFRDQLGIGKDEMACIIGDKVSLALHESRCTEEEDTDGNTPEPEFAASSVEFTIPEWLDAFAENKPYFRAVVGAPVLVSTVDFLIAAGMPHRQGHHVAALLRFADSDLILDEVDGYDPKPLVAILRLVQLAALFGRNVICSTATLAEPVAVAVHAAYQCGAAMRAALEGSPPAFGVAFIDNHALPKVVEAGQGADFQTLYREHLARMKPAFGRARERIPCLQPVAERSVAAWREAVRAAVERLHRSQAWTPVGSRARVSFGLVRVANIEPAIDTARFLAEALPQARVACYHSGDLVIQRFLKEKTLDCLLKRKDGNGTIVRYLQRHHGPAMAEGGDRPFIVVATPVEEIGRDHDFDWAVIEPSSTRSIVQTAGRVNRHRRERVEEPNVAILQYNLRWARGEKTVFCRPGFESADVRYDSHDLRDLLDWDRLRSLDAGLMFESHRFAALDDGSIDKTLKDPLHRLFNLETTRAWWIGQSIYDEFPLREDEHQLHIHWDGEDEFRFLFPISNKETQRAKRSVRCESRAANDWLVWSPSELLDECLTVGIKPEDGMRVSIQGHDLKKLLEGQYLFDRSFGFHGPIS
jgi:CRISPR-associated endonuclease/helicase Cas3